MNYLKKKKRELAFLLGFLVIMGFICLIFYKPIMHILSHPQQLRNQLQSLGILGQLSFIFIMVLQVIFVFLPGEIIEVMAGFLYGPIYGMIACLIGSAIGSTIIFKCVQKFGIPFLKKFFDLKYLEELQFLQNKDNYYILLFIIFFVPGTPKDLLTYFVPLTHVNFSKFLLLTTIARIPSIITSTIGGNALGTEKYLFSIFVFTLTALISIVGILIYKKLIHKKDVCNL